eukprot:SAG31_NODE_405_length_16084_cov_3.913982_1_plen_102_part_00
MPRVGGRLLAVGMTVAAVYMLLNFFLMASLEGPAPGTQQFYDKKMEEERWRKTAARARRAAEVGDHRPAAHASPLGAALGTATRSSPSALSAAAQVIQLIP